MMMELSTSLAEPEAPDNSTQLGDSKPTEASPSKPPEAEKKPESRMDAIKRAAEDVGVKEPKDDVREDVAEKPVAQEKVEEPQGDAKPEAEKPAAEAKPETEKPKRQQIEAPAKFLPRAKELWQNTPHEVRSEMQRVMQEAEAETTQARETVKEFEAIKPYAEMARRSGTTIDVALSKYIQMEQTLRADPANGFKALLGNMQINPVQAIGHILSAYGVRPQQLAEHIMQAPNEYTALARPQQQQQAPQPSSEVAVLQQQLQALQQSMQHNEVEAKLIAPFAAEHPRYYELEDSIAQFLGSGMVPATLSPRDRLAAAYDLAVRISPSIKPASEAAPKEEDGRAGTDFGGDKSVRGAPATGVDTSSRRRGKLSRGDALTAAMAELGIAH